MSLEAALDDGRDRLEDATHVLHGPQGNQARKEVAYAAYVTLIVVGLYGFPVLRALVIAGDRAGMAAALKSPWAVALAIGLIAAVLAMAREAGRVRGPVVAPVPWVDHVVTSSIDRWDALRPWFGYALFTTLFAGGLSGLLVGASLWGAGVAASWVLPVAVLVALVIGLGAGTAWLLGQSRLSPPLPRRSAGAWWRQEVRRLGLQDLRTQAARSGRIVGGVQAGDLRAVRLEAARPVTRGRTLRLRHRGPVGTLVARDVLGLRRSSGAAVVGIVASAAAAVALGGALGSPSVPPLVAFVGGLVSYLGMGALSEGLRLEADTMGTPALFGAPPVRAAAAHLVVPGTLHLLVTTTAGAVTGLAAGATLAAVLPWCVISTLFALGGSLLAAYRGRPPTSPFNPVPNAQTIVLWYSAPLVLCTLLIGGTVWGATQWPASGPFVIVTWVAAVWIVYAGLNRAQRESLAHRDV
ncbi:hypothetical protein N802_09260 [Knoellia sinensis KCTC 19936]|uniref:Uncharacterized protein n=1 Tax=Knoellia sinensis KCTC 19936 TaxID=1385520 RepID=A0A0A0J2D8_9MICO|nr:hypothetical protein [Knoellia sinensis]KGN30322.1 hypothetical protein N802_09260 [Knoellia sinensis KCTC 19936]